MPPKKTPSEAGETKFGWTAENDRLLLILTMGRTLTTDDYSRLVDAIPGSNYNGVRIRASRMRIEQRSRFEALGWRNVEGVVKGVKINAKANTVLAAAGIEGSERTAKMTAETAEIAETAKTTSTKRKTNSETDGDDNDSKCDVETRGEAKKARVKKGGERSGAAEVAKQEEGEEDEDGGGEIKIEV
ncbi:uncharacterized protein EKO05_0003145 [Ascochyta rabiei]|uniref:Uncharacterized protein n=1 Tax=Didymella rabiei TaxID=5454 RepID=A0A163BL05_DIDRA|nr:uncharacterized protein EKO05_0003145 [Ascochyta rabiei]KZM21830.1 hypothetical protein ST47_g7032 [Ascochyta rabiei]UPX12603.1 hypothetical protein EKO05_0003145 [Ascochyta rabiei]